ncbi:MAG TPA: histone deacetylase [Cellvibrionaceae bacterium]|nr:histone deacetylase [Cellvibrionaceae bacterium]HMW70782.1 histone deacetylase [Cellvibrionaceae bacterium]HMY38252.1 histone deacetylase [Marinagarivorans sp.]HNG60158.1 histone deacetylase [Cellvibrionaceae bacterium]
MPIPLVANPVYSYPFPAQHRFPMEKFALLQNYVAAQGWLVNNPFYRPGKASLNLLQLAHCPAYLQRFIHNQQSPAELKAMGLPWSEALVRRTLISPNGTLLTALLALEKGIACHLAGGTHHAHANFAAGFCILNDLAVAALALIKQRKVKRVLIFDCDVHQGDGTARILENHPTIFTCSIHCEANFPSEKARSHLDIALPRGTQTQDYLLTLQTTLMQAIALSQPDIILYDAGVDIYAQDPLGHFAVSEAGIYERDLFVLNTCKSLGIPVATVIGGGYDDNRAALAARHALVIKAAVEVFTAQSR